jgi:small subunit ribosomal protein S4
MGRNIGPKNKIARRFGINLGLKSNPTKVAKRLSQPPGVHGPKKHAGASTGYGKQLLEKQKAKLIYGLRERQFSNLVTEATGHKGDSGISLQRMLETRLDNVIYRLGIALTRAQARQMVSHNMFLVNGKKMNIPSYRVKTGDVIDLKDNKKNKKIFDGMAEKLNQVQLPSWLIIDAKKMSAKVLGEPKAEDFEKSFDVKLIVEFYSAR